MINKDHVEAVYGADMDTESISNHVPDTYSDSGSSIVSCEESTGSTIELEEARLSVHCLVQEALIYSRSPQERQTIFDAAVHIMHEAFPSQVDGETLNAKIEQCTRLLPHIESLVKRYDEFRSSPGHVLRPSEKFGNLLKSCLWQGILTTHSALANLS